MSQSHTATMDRSSASLYSRLELGLWLVGIICLTWVASTWLDARQYRAQVRQDLFAQSSVAAARTADTGAVLANDPRLAPASPTARDIAAASFTIQDPSESSAAAGPRELRGLIEIPRLGVSAPIATGDDEDTLARAVGHIPGTAYPGEPGNVGLAAHRDGYFRPLEDIKLNDEILIKTMEGTHRYRVLWKQVVEPTEVPVLYPTDKPSLTLVTCYPFRYVGPAPQRLIVRAQRVS